jgi:uncharacterized membrane protein
VSKRNDVVDDDDLDLDDVAPVDPDPDLLQPSSLAWRRRTAIEMVISGLIGLYAAFVLAIEAWELAGGKTEASCDFNSKISCTAVAESWQATLLGFPNAFVGIAAEAVVLTVALAILGGVVFPRWFMQIAQVIYTAGLVFAWWLFYEAYTDIKALCPWCLLITVTTTLVWAGLTRLNIRDRVISLPGRAGPWGRRFVQSGNDWYVTIAVLVGLAGLVWLGYGYTLL